MIEQFIEKNISYERDMLICDAIAYLEDYVEQGYTLTVRQLYYRFVADDKIENSQRSYNRLQDAIADGRLLGKIDWCHITDRTRSLRKYTMHKHTWDLLETLPRIFDVDHWENQPVRMEVWVEKDALIEIVGEACHPYQVPYFSCRGYTSLTAMYDGAKRIESHWRYGSGQRTIILHLGDHDPSGIDMTYNIHERLDQLSGRSCEVEVRRIALTMAQIEEFEPPPNPAKESDSRYKKYVQAYGTKSWELDALEPRVIETLIASHVNDEIDSAPWIESHDRTTDGECRLRDIAAQDKKRGEDK